MWFHAKRKVALLHVSCLYGCLFTCKYSIDSISSSSIVSMHSLRRSATRCGIRLSFVATRLAKISFSVFFSVVAGTFLSSKISLKQPKLLKIVNVCEMLTAALQHRNDAAFFLSGSRGMAHHADSVQIIISFLSWHRQLVAASWCVALATQLLVSRSFAVWGVSVPRSLLRHLFRMMAASSSLLSSLLNCSSDVADEKTAPLQQLLPLIC